MKCFVALFVLSVFASVMAAPAEDLLKPPPVELVQTAPVDEQPLPGNPPVLPAEPLADGTDPALKRDKRFLIFLPKILFLGK